MDCFPLYFPVLSVSVSLNVSRCLTVSLFFFSLHIFLSQSLSLCVSVCRCLSFCSTSNTLSLSIRLSPLINKNTLFLCRALRSVVRHVVRMRRATFPPAAISCAGTRRSSICLDTLQVRRHPGYVSPQYVEKCWSQA